MVRKQKGTSEPGITNHEPSTNLLTAGISRLGRTILAVVMHLARGGPAIVQPQNPRRDPFRIKTVANGVAAERGNQDKNRIDRFPSRRRQSAICACPNQCDSAPNHDGNEPFHATPVSGPFPRREAADTGFGGM